MQKNIKMMDIIALDSNVVIDFTTYRQDYEISSALFDLIGEGKIDAYITAKQLCDIHYQIRKYYHNEKIAREIIKELIVTLAIVDSSSLASIKAADSKISDFEDAVLINSLKENGISTLITRNIKDFKDSGLKVYTPKQATMFYLKK